MFVAWGDRHARICDTRSSTHTFRSRYSNEIPCSTLIPNVNSISGRLILSRFLMVWGSLPAQKAASSFVSKHANQMLAFGSTVQYSTVLSCTVSGRTWRLHCIPVLLQCTVSSSNAKPTNDPLRGSTVQCCTVHYCTLLLVVRPRHDTPSIFTCCTQMHPFSPPPPDGTGEKK